MHKIQSTLKAIAAAGVLGAMALTCAAQTPAPAAKKKEVKDQGEFVPGEPYLFALDPDGNEVEIWYELPTTVDPPARRRQPAPRPRRRSGTRA